ncbi:MAG: polyhydroxybutyrate depolymerase [Paracoccaceae bacterium]|nr:polyhydroxybutyrate depolymerase [Paracoccaceae bacterium]
MLRLIPFALAAFLPFAALACGPDTDCRIGTRSYRAALPPQSDGRTDGRAIIMFHGYGGSAAAEMRNAGMRRMASDLGAVYVAAQAGQRDWNIPGSPSENRADPGAELAYFDALLADLGARFGVDPQQTLVTGFSAGGMVVWQLACFRGDRVAGFAPMSGTFWAPVPQDCTTGAVNLIHSHGTRDKVVPMAGRAVASTRQGDVARAFDLMTRTGGYGPARPVAMQGFECARQTNPAGKMLELCTFDGGHSFNPRFLRRVWADFGLGG